MKKRAHPPTQHTDLYDEQALQCMQAAQEHSTELLRGAVQLAGSSEAGRELYHEAIVRAHDTIQRYGFYGDGYQYYIWRIIKNLHTELQSADRQLRRRYSDSDLLCEQLDPVTGADARQALADQINFELEQMFPAADVAAFRLHVAGQSCREIEQLTGRNYRTVSRVINVIKGHLAGMFRPHFDSLEQ